MRYKKISFSSYRLRSSLLALTFIFSVIIGSLATPLALLNENASAAAPVPTTQAACEALGDTWQAGNASNYGKASCTGRASCAITGGVWSPSQKSCTTGNQQLSDKMAAMSLEDRAKSFSYYKAVYRCIDEYLKKDSIDASIDSDGLNTLPKDGYWYGDGPSDPNKHRTGRWPAYSYHIAEVTFMGSSDAKCSQLTTDALSFWGLGTPGELLKALNYKYDGDKEQWQATDGKKDVGLFKAMVEKAGIATTLTSDVQYYLTRTAFGTYCQPNSLGAYDSQSASRKKKIDEYSAFSGELPAQTKITEIDNSGTALAVNAYEYHFGPTDSTDRMESMYPIFEDGDNTYENADAAKTCLNMIDTISSTSVSALNSTLTSACTALGLTIPNDLAACKAGLQFKSRSDFCTLAFSDAVLQEDCAKGQGATNELPPADTDQATEPKSSCVVEGVGWIVCPVLGFLSNITDEIYKLVGGWLKVNITLFDAGSSTYKGWTIMRDIANIGFAIIFLIVIYSQLTGAGISNYGVKKMLPRLVVMAIAINASFYITQLMVDISNILGSSLKAFFDSSAVFNNSNDGFLAGNNTFANIGGSLLAGTAGAAVVTGAVAGVVAYGGIGLFIMIILAAIVAVAVTLLILAARQAFIVILIVVSPLAFLAMILPNTKKWYDNWRKIFISLLVIYPMVAVLFGASEMAAGIIVKIPGYSLMGLAVATIPLFAVIPMLKGSLNAVPIAGNLASKFAKGTSLGGNIRNRSKQARGNLMNDARSRALGIEGGGRAGRATRWLAGSQARGAERNRRFGANASRADAAYTAERALTPGSGASDSERAAAVGAQHKLEEEEIANIMTLDRHNNKRPSDHLGTLRSQSSTHAQRVAAARAIGATGGQGDVNAMAAASSLEHLTTGERAEIADVAAKRMGTNNPAFGGPQIAKIASGQFDANSAYVAHAKSNNMTARSLLDMHDGSRSELIKQIKLSGDAEANAALARITAQIMDQPELEAKAGQALVTELRRPATAPDNNNPGPITPQSAASVQIDHNRNSN